MSSVSLRHFRHLPRQLPVVASFGRAVLSSMRGTTGHAPAGEVTATVPPIPATLVRDYVEHVGGNPSAYRNTVPPHLFPQWGLGLAARTLNGSPYPLTKVVNAGCRIEVNAPLPVGKPLRASASLVSIDDDGRRALITQRVVTGTSDEPEAVVATLRVIVPVSSKGAKDGAPKKPAAKSRTEIPYDAHELARYKLDKDAGLAFALLTGDFNPIHWIDRAGVAAGFGGPILHGFATIARTIEGLIAARFSGDITRVRAWDAKLTRPLKLPAEVALYSRGDDAWLGDTLGGAAYLHLVTELR